MGPDFAFDPNFSIGAIPPGPKAPPRPKLQNQSAQALANSPDTHVGHQTPSGNFGRQFSADLAWFRNLSEAEKNRDIQLFTSNTAHQREVRDLKKAGLNPILSAMKGGGASTIAGGQATSPQAEFKGIMELFGDIFKAIGSAAKMAAA